MSKKSTHTCTPRHLKKREEGGLRKEGTRVDSFMSQRENDGECFSSPFQSFCLHLFCCLIFSSPPLSTFYFLPPPPPASCISLISLFSLHLTPSFPSGYSPHLSLSLSLPPLNLPQPYFLHPIALSFSNPSFFPAVIRSVRTAATGWAPNKN